MKIGIEAHTIEKEEKLGAGGNYLGALLKCWSKLDPQKYKFVLYFKERIPQEDFLNSPVFEKKIAVNPFKIKSLALFYNLSLPLLAKKDKIDVLFLPYYMRPFFCWTPTITAIHDISYEAHPEWVRWRYGAPQRLLSRLAAKTSKFLITCSEFSKQEIIKYYKIPIERVKMIYLGASRDFNNRRDEAKIAEIKKKYGLSDKYFFYAGSIFSRRHVLESLRAFELLLKDYPDYQFLVSGRDITFPSQNIDSFIEKINKRFPNAVKRVRYIDYDDLCSIYQGAELFVCLSEYEGFGLPVLEAMSCGAPVLTINKTSLAEVTGGAAFYVDNPNNIEEIKSVMEKSIIQKDLRDDIIKNALKQAEKFSWEKCAEETLRVIVGG